MNVEIYHGVFAFARTTAAIGNRLGETGQLEVVLAVLKVMTQIGFLWFERHVHLGDVVNPRAEPKVAFLLVVREEGDVNGTRALHHDGDHPLDCAVVGDDDLTPSDVDKTVIVGASP